MSEGDWIETCNHAAAALEPDFLPRSWTPLAPVEGLDMIVYNCKLARILLHEGPFGMAQLWRQLSVFVELQPALFSTLPVCIFISILHAL